MQLEPEFPARLGRTIPSISMPTVSAVFLVLLVCPELTSLLSDSIFVTFTIGVYEHSD